MNPTVLALIEQLFGNAENFFAGKAVTVNIPQETVTVGGMKVACSESFTLQKVG